MDVDIGADVGRAVRRDNSGQALIEFALVVPVILLTIWLFVDLAFALMARAAVSSVAIIVTQQAADSGGEDNVVDALVQSAASQHGLALDRLLVRIDTSAGAGTWHFADWHGTGGSAHSSVYPPQAPWGTPVQVHLRYADPITVPFLGTRSVTLSGDGAMASQYGEDLAP